MKKLFCSGNVFPSYVGHLLGLSEIFHDGEYSQKYSKFVSNSDIAWLNRNKELFKWGNGMAGPLFGYCLLISGYVNPSNEQRIREYFESLKLIGDTSDVSCLLKAFPELIEYQLNWGRLDHPQAIEMLKSYTNEINQFKDILISNWNQFIENVWPVEQNRIMEAVDTINQKLSEYELIEKWEKATGFEFQCNKYEFVLSSGMRKAPRFNSLGYDKNWVYFETPLLFESIIHEIGTHLLRPIQQSIMSDFEYLHVYNSFETLCCVLTEIIFKDVGLRGSILKDSKVFDSDSYEFFTDRIKTVPVLDLSKLLMEYLDLQKENYRRTTE